MSRFVIIAAPRTGSSLLVSLLESHPDILCRGEVFHPGDRPIRDLDPAIDTDWINTERRERPVAFLDWLYAQDAGHAHVGFKIFADHEPRVLDHVLADRDIRKIVLRRDNFLAVYSSAMIARERKSHAYKIGETPPETKIKFEPKRFEKLRERYRVHYAAVEAALAGQEHFALEYHEVGDPAVQAGLLAFLGATPHDLVSDQLKANPGDLLARVVNPAKTRRYLEEAGLGGWAGVEAPVAHGAAGA